MNGPPMTYRVTLADLCEFADCAAELDSMRQFYVDQPGEQARIAGHVERLHNIVERAAAQYAELIYAPGDGS